jgi:hypothetical protein
MVAKPRSFERSAANGVRRRWRIGVEMVVLGPAALYASSLTGEGDSKARSHRCCEFGAYTGAEIFRRAAPIVGFIFKLHGIDLRVWRN